MKLSPQQLTKAVKYWLSHIERFSRLVIQRPLRSYQREPAEAILDSILNGRGMTFAVMMSRQAGKNELSGQLEAYLMNLYQRKGGQIVKASPTFKPQTINSLLRLCDRLDNPWNKGRWRRREGYMVELGKARTLFFSADPSASVVGATASLLLEGDEGQDITAEKWAKDFRPMGASTNVTTVLWGTAWTDTTLLATTIQHLKRQEAQDGRRRVFCYDAQQVGAEVPAYAQYVKTEVARMGRNHPLIKTQYYLETIAGAGKMFSPQRIALMRGSHERQLQPTPGRRYALLIDVAGEDEIEGEPMERLMLANPRRDASACTFVEVEITPGELPSYRVVNRQFWLGVQHAALYHNFKALAQRWRPAWMVVDATGVGAGIASFLATALGEIVIPFQFSSKTKSDLGWDFLAIVETGRYQDYADDQGTETRQFWYEVGACEREVVPGPSRTLKWGVWESPAYDGLVARGHDDLLISAAMTAVLDRQVWPGTGSSATATTHTDVLQDIDSAKW
jgi:hypothetical protein